MNKNILFVDDEYDVLSSYRRNFRVDYNVKIATNAIEALDVLGESEEIAVIISDYRMPKINGVDFLKQAQEKYPDTIRIIITGYADLQIAIEAVNKGNIFRFLTKPCPVDQLKNVINDSLEIFRLKKSEKQLLNNTLKGIISVLIEMQSQLQPYLVKELRRIRYLSQQIIVNMKLNVNWEFDIALMLSKFGYITIPQDIIEKKINGEELEKEEKLILHSYPKHGSELIKKIPRMEGIAKSILYQDMYYDGSNYPDAELKENNIPIVSRILKLLSDFSDLISKGKSINVALSLLQEKSKIEYDPVLLANLRLVLQNQDDIEIVKSIKFKELRIGMILAKSIIDSNRNVLVKKGTEINDIILMKLIHASKVRHIVEPVIVIEKDG